MLELKAFQNPSIILLRRSSFLIGSYSEIYQQNAWKIPAKKFFFLERYSVSINKISEIQV